MIVGAASVAAPVVAPHDPYACDLQAYRQPPSRLHLLGTDSAGRDVLSRLIYAGRVSLSVGLVSVGLSASIGIILGSLSGYHGGKVDTVVMRFTDVVMSFPGLVVMITLVAVMGPSIYNCMLAIGLLGWPGICRLVRAEVLSLRERDYVQAAVCVGNTTGRVIMRHLLPNVLPTIMVNVTFGLAGAIISEASLSFLGLGVPPPVPSWGNMMFDAQSITILATMPWMWLPPGIMICLSVLAINFIGDGLRDALDPQMMD